MSKMLLILCLFTSFAAADFNTFTNKDPAKYRVVDKLPGQDQGPTGVKPVNDSAPPFKEVFKEIPKEDPGKAPVSPVVHHKPPKQDQNPPETRKDIPKPTENPKDDKKSPLEDLKKALNEEDKQKKSLHIFRIHHVSVQKFHSISLLQTSMGWAAMAEARFFEGTLKKLNFGQIVGELSFLKPQLGVGGIYFMDTKEAQFFASLLSQMKFSDYGVGIKVMAGRQQALSNTPINYGRASAYFYYDKVGIMSSLDMLTAYFGWVSYPMELTIESMKALKDHVKNGEMIAGLYYSKDIADNYAFGLEYGSGTISATLFFKI